MDKNGLPLDIDTNKDDLVSQGERDDGNQLEWDRLTPQECDQLTLWTIASSRDWIAKHYKLFHKYGRNLKELCDMFENYTGGINMEDFPVHVIPYGEDSFEAVAGKEKKLPPNVEISDAIQRALLQIPDEAEFRGTQVYWSAGAGTNVRGFTQHRGYVAVGAGRSGFLVIPKDYEIDGKKVPFPHPLLDTQLREDDHTKVRSIAPISSDESRRIRIKELVKDFNMPFLLAYQLVPDIDDVAWEEFNPKQQNDIVALIESFVGDDEYWDISVLDLPSGDIKRRMFSTLCRSAWTGMKRGAAVHGSAFYDIQKGKIEKIEPIGIRDNPSLNQEERRILIHANWIGVALGDFYTGGEEIAVGLVIAAIKSLNSVGHLSKEEMHLFEGAKRLASTMINIFDSRLDRGINDRYKYEDFYRDSKRSRKLKEQLLELDEKF